MAEPGIKTRSINSWFIRSEFDPAVTDDLISSLVISPAKLFSADDNTYVYKADETTTVIKVAFGDRDYVVKRFNPRNTWHRVKRALRQSRARRCWNMAREFRLAGIRTARPSGWVEQRWGPLRGNSYYICEHIPGEVCLGWLPDQDESTWAEFSNQVEDLFAAMGRDGLWHGDMKASNLIWSDGALYVIDLDAAGRALTGLRRKRLHQRDWIRFMRNWSDAPALRAWLARRFSRFP
jgi:tRNA A-37 threonylcarbamoyl transferase component Bud32